MVIIVSVLLSSFILKLIISEDLSNNSVIKNYQIKKINSIEFKKIDTIFVGDSSGGNAINAKFFNELSGLNTKNLCLTGSWGIIGSLGIIKRAYEKNPNIKNIIIIQTLDIWDRGYPKESIFKLFPINDFLKHLSMSDIFRYYFNPKQIIRSLKFFFNYNSNLLQIDSENDYLLQNKEKYSNAMKIVNNSSSLNKVILSEDKKKELKMLENFCQENSINCIFLNGPVHHQLIKNSTIFMKYKNNVIDSQFSYIKYLPNIISYKNNEMGDSLDHVDVKFKHQSTLDYYELIKSYLIY